MPEDHDACLEKAKNHVDNAHVRPKELPGEKHVFLCFQDHGPTTHGYVHKDNTPAASKKKIQKRRKK